MSETEHQSLSRSSSKLSNTFEPKDIKNEHAEVPDGPRTITQGSIASNLTMKDSEVAQVTVPEKPAFGPRVYGQLTTDIGMSAYSETKRNPLKKIPQHRSSDWMKHSPFSIPAASNSRRDRLIRLQKTRPPKMPRHDIKKMRNLTRVASLSRRLVGHDPFDSFAKNCEEVMPEWILLLGKTTFPSDISSSDHHIIAAFKALDKVISGQEGTYLLRRLAYVQLMRVFATLESVIKREREIGWVLRKPGYRDASVAIDLYMAAQDNRSRPDDLRRELKERKRAGRSWTDLAGTSPLFTMIYSDVAEPIVRDFRRTDSATLKLVASNILEQCPDELVRMSAQLANIADSAAMLGYSFDMHRITATQIRQSLGVF